MGALLNDVFGRERAVGALLSDVFGRERAVPPHAVCPPLTPCPPSHSHPQDVPTAMKLGAEAAKEVTKLFPPPVKLEFEKVSAYWY